MYYGPDYVNIRPTRTVVAKTTITKTKKFKKKNSPKYYRISN